MTFLRAENLTGVEPMIRDWVSERITAHVAPSCSVVVAQRGHELLSYVAGDATIGEHVATTSTRYRVASCSKSFTAVAILQLRDRGLLHLDAPITTYVPTYRHHHMEEYAVATVRQLLGMSGGLGTDDPWGDRQESITPQELATVVSRGVYLTHVPGSTFEYSNLGYALLGRVVEEISGLLFWDYVRAEILHPLGLDDITYDYSTVPAQVMATGYRFGPTGFEAQPWAAPGSFSSIGGVICTARDLSRWAQWLASAHHLPAGEAGPLSSASRREMQNVVTPMPFASRIGTGVAERQGGYGLGLFVEQNVQLERFVSHSGGYPGYGAHMVWHVPTGLSVVALENGRYSGASALTRSIMTLLLEDMLDTTSNHGPWAETVELMHVVHEKLRDGTFDDVRPFLEENVDMDISVAERAENLRTLFAQVGRPTLEAPTLRPHLSDSPLHAVWLMSCEHGRLRAQLRRSPVVPGKIQTLIFVREDEEVF